LGRYEEIWYRNYPRQLGDVWQRAIRLLWHPNGYQFALPIPVDEELKLNPLMTPNPNWSEIIFKNNNYFNMRYINQFFKAIMPLIAISLVDAGMP
jgi:hypothetical protein